MRNHARILKIIAALFVTIWDIYGVAFQDVLPSVGVSGAAGKAKESGGEILPDDFDSESKPPSD